MASPSPGVAGWRQRALQLPARIALRHRRFRHVRWLVSRTARDRLDVATDMRPGHSSVGGVRLRARGEALIRLLLSRLPGVMREAAHHPGFQSPPAPARCRGKRRRSDICMSAAASTRRTRAIAARSVLMHEFINASEFLPAWWTVTTLAILKPGRERKSSDFAVARRAGLGLSVRVRASGVSSGPRML